MRCRKFVALFTISLMMLSLSGCGSGSSGTSSANNPFGTGTSASQNTDSSGTTVEGSLFPCKLSLASDKTSVGINSEAIFSATLVTVGDSAATSVPVQNQTVVFTIVGGPASFVDRTVTTDSSGTAISRLKTDATTSSSSNVIVMASATINGATVNAYSTLRVVRQNSYLINFLTSAGTSDPSGNLVTLTYTITPPVGGPAFDGYVTFKQLVPFQVLDNNGVPKPNVDVSIEVFNYGRDPDTIIELVPPYPGSPVLFPPDRTVVTIRTDDHGMGIFTCNVSLLAPAPGLANTESIIYKATAGIASENISLQSYGGFIATVTQLPIPSPPTPTSEPTP